jgi:CheY-like chemotaxis protein
VTDNKLGVLLVEDNDGDAFLVEEAVRLNGQMTVFRTKTIREALAAVQPWQPHIVLLDLNLPDSKGLDTLDTFRKFFETHNKLPPPIVVMTSLSDDDVAAAAIQRGAQDYLVKQDVDGTSLIRAIRYAVNRQGRTAIEATLAAPEHARDLGEVMRVVQRINRVDQAVSWPPSSQAHELTHDPLDVPQVKMLGKATEVILEEILARLGRLEQTADPHLMKQLERLIVGNGVKPLSTRIELIERAISDLVDERKEKKGTKVQIWVGVVIAVVAAASGWVFSLFQHK